MGIHSVTGLNSGSAGRITEAVVAAGTWSWATPCADALVDPKNKQPLTR